MKINIACGPNVFPFPGWLNVDKHDFSAYYAFLPTAPHAGMPEHQRDLANFLLESPEQNEFRRHDMTEPFAFVHDRSAELIYVGQAIEHLNYLHQVPAFLAECYRMLRPGGILRITTPDLDKLLKLYSFRQLSSLGPEQPAYFAAATEEERLALVMFGAGGADCTQGHYEGHQHCYTQPTMRRLLFAAGFSGVTFSPPTRGEIRDEGLSHSMVVEACR